MPCIEAIEYSLKESDIEKLLPLERAIIPMSTRIAEELQEKWKSRPAPVIKQKPTNIDEIKSKWERNTYKPEVEPIDVSPITIKWK